MNLSTQDKNAVKINALPPELIIQITKFLSLDEQRSLAHSCQFFKKNIPLDYLVNRVLKYVAAGNQDEVVRLLTMRPYLTSARGKLIDWNKRVFYCSPLTYAIWALDVRYLARAMVHCLPKNQEGENIRKKLLAQFESTQKKGITFLKNDTEYNEKHFNFAPVKEALFAYFSGYDAWDKTMRQKNWLAVGNAQAEFPVYIRQHYCDPEVRFSPTPSFQHPTFKRSLVFYNWTTGKDNVWDEKLTGLGDSFSMRKAALLKCDGDGDAGPVGKRDYEALLALEKTRTTIDLEKLKELLETPLIDQAQTLDMSQNF